MSERRKYSPEKKAAVMEALLTGQSITHVAKLYKVPEGTVAAWKARDCKNIASVASEKREEIGTLLIEYLRANLETLRQQVESFRNPRWLEQQDASSAAVLHGVLADKSVRLLEALGTGDGSPDAPEEPTEDSQMP